MKVLEIKNNLVKIAYDVKDNLALSSFIIIEDENTPYVAQVINLKTDTTTNFAIVKLLFTFNAEGILKSYNGTIPSLKATVSQLPSNELLDILPVEKPIKLGTLAQQEFILKVDKSIFESNLVICSSKQENTNILLDNILRQFEPIKQKTVVFDTTGEINFDNKITFGSDFKLPLNYETINFIYDNELDDVDATSKAIIQDIFIEVQEYTKTLPEGFIPFDSFFSVVDQQYKETGITQLVLLKNKLLKYRDAEVFAQTLKDVLKLSIAIEKTDIIEIDISALTPKLQNEVISYTYDVMSNIKDSIYSFLKTENGTVNKKLLRKLLNKNNVSTSFVCSHDYKYLNELKQNAENLILFAPLTLQHDFASYNSFLNKLNGDEYIVYGNLTQGIPLIVQLEEIEIDEPIQAKEEVEEETTVPMPFPVKQTPQEESIIETELPEVKEDTSVSEELIDENLIIQDEIKEPLIIEEEVIPELINNIEPIIEESQVNNLQEEILIEEPTLDIYELEEELEEEIIIDDSELIEEEIIPIELEETSDIEIIDSSLDIENNFPIAETEQEDDIPIEELELPVTDELVDELTEDDLNFIEELSIEEPQEDIDFNSSEIEEESLPEPDFIEEQIEVPVVPIYPADNSDDTDTPIFEAGDAVSHPKYGEGNVEKMIKYGNKTLYSVSFKNVAIGRRLLDPTITELKKI